MKSRKGLSIIAFCALGALGCAKERHLSSHFGRSYQAALERQAERPAPQVKHPVRGLDPQDAAVIARSYRRGLSGKTSGQEPVAPIIVAPPAQGHGMPDREDR